jgi:hypothetical protein
MASSRMMIKVAALLDKLPERLDSVVREASELRDKTNFSVARLDSYIAGVKKENDDREMRQTLRDQNNVRELTNLHKVTQASFDVVSKDVQQLLTLNQKLNERISQLESRLNQPAFLIDQKLVNEKLKSVYDVTGDLEKRVSEVEAFRQAYIDYAKAASVLSKIGWKI